MYLDINNKKYLVEIEYKEIRNIYLRVKDDLTIYVTAPVNIKEKKVIEFINSNVSFIEKRINKIEVKKVENEGKIRFLGKYYDIIYINSGNIDLIDNKAYIDKSIDIDKYYKKIAKKVFKERLDLITGKINDVPYPNLRIRKMTTRWGVCNPKLKTITLNLELIKYAYPVIDYVIIHELCHFIEQNHSKSFWNLVEKYMPNYKIYRKELKER